MRKNGKPGLLERVFSAVMPGWQAGGSRVPLRSNVYPGSGGYGKIGGSTGVSQIFRNSDRTSPLLGTAQPSKKISGYYDRMSESRQYELLDISRLSVSFFSDFVLNFIDRGTTEPISIIDPDTGSTDQQVTDRINEVLNKQIGWLQYIETHLGSSIFYGAYYGMLKTGRDDSGHLKFNVLPLIDPNAVIIKRTLDAPESFIAKGSDDQAYEIPYEECFYLGTPNMQLDNDLRDTTPKSPGNVLADMILKKDSPRPGAAATPVLGDPKNRDKVIEPEYYVAAMPLFYSSLLKLKELVVKDLLISLLSLRDLSTPSILALMFDKGVPMENAEELCTKVQRMLNSYNDLSSFLSAQFDVTSLIENVLSQSTKVIPDFNATIQNKGLISTDKLSDKILEMMQTLDQNRQSVLSTIGLPASILDSTSGNKWAILQSSERANSRVNSIMLGIKESTVQLVRKIYRVIYKSDLDPSLVRIHFLEKSTVEYNNTLNTIENISSLVQGISGVLTTALQTLESTVPLIDPKAFIGYIQGMIKDADPGTGELINDQSIQDYLKVMERKVRAQYEQMGLDLGDIDFLKQQQQ
nr:MAG TPA: hypothetical protein [Caudoviricetes sp.]